MADGQTERVWRPRSGVSGREAWLAV